MISHLRKSQYWAKGHGLGGKGHALLSLSHLVCLPKLSGLIGDKKLPREDADIFHYAFCALEAVPPLLVDSV